jgi:hypothetical protein
MYTLDAVEYSEATKQPFAVTEVLSIGTLNYNATAFKGPVLVSKVLQACFIGTDSTGPKWGV